MTVIGEQLDLRWSSILASLLTCFYELPKELILNDMADLTSHVQALKDELAKAQKAGASMQGRSLSNKENEVSN